MPSLLQNFYNTSISEKEDSLKADGHMGPDELLEDYLQRIEQYVNVDFPEHHTGKNWLKVFKLHVQVKLLT